MTEFKVVVIGSGGVGAYSGTHILPTDTTLLIPFNRKVRSHHPVHPKPFCWCKCLSFTVLPRNRAYKSLTVYFLRFNRNMIPLSKVTCTCSDNAVWRGCTFTHRQFLFVCRFIQKASYYWQRNQCPWYSWYRWTRVRTRLSRHTKNSIITLPLFW